MELQRVAAGAVPELAREVVPEVVQEAVRALQADFVRPVAYMPEYFRQSLPGLSAYLSKRTGLQREDTAPEEPASVIEMVRIDR